MDTLRKEIEQELKRTRLDKARLYDLLLKIVDNSGAGASAGAQGATGPAGPTGSAGPRGVQGVAGPTGPAGPACVCKCVSVEKKVVPKKKVVTTTVV